MTQNEIRNAVKSVLGVYKARGIPVDIADIVEIVSVMTRRQHEETARKALHVLAEYHFDLYGDIEGCNGDELSSITEQMKAVGFIAQRMRSYLSGAVDNPRGVISGEQPMTPEPQFGTDRPITPDPEKL